jgi:hypothetical protein
MSDTNTRGRKVGSQKSAFSLRDLQLMTAQYGVTATKHERLGFFMLEDTYPEIRTGLSDTAYAGKNADEVAQAFLTWLADSSPEFLKGIREAIALKKAASGEIVAIESEHDDDEDEDEI